MTQISENSTKVLQELYLERDEKGITKETPTQLYRRVAKNIASAEIFWGDIQSAEKWEEKFFEIMENLLFLPNSPTLMNAGTASRQLSACFVLPIEDSNNSIFSTLKSAEVIQQTGGGTGFNFTHVRPKNDFFHYTDTTIKGPISYMKMFNFATEKIRHNGKRRGANIGILDISHPDIEEFIDAKSDKNVLNNFNISVAVSDEFMKTLQRNGDWTLIHPQTKAPIKTIHARTLWNKIVESAWHTGDPGLIFIDTINSQNATPLLGSIESTNPCGEVPLLPNESCNLGSINVSKLVNKNNGSYEIDWHKLEEVVTTSIRFLDNVIEVNNYTSAAIKNMSLGNRKIGLGIMGWAELLIKLELPYDCERAVRLAGQLMQFVQQQSFDTSVLLAKERGVFPNWEKSIYFPHQPIRNATRTSIAPTGTISIIAETSSSIEPLFALAYQKQHVLHDETLTFINPLFINYLKENHLYSESVVEDILLEGVITETSSLPYTVKELFKTALQIEPNWHLCHQLAFQRFTDNAVSKTINLPEDASIKEVDEIYKKAWLQKAKGITIFRYNSKGYQVMSQGVKYETSNCEVCV
jgi:ribonucleoside-diphosphate reductase alpha chain